MIYANKNGDRVKAIKTGDRALCPLCEEELIAKCGPHKINHWSHKIVSDCDYGNKGMSQWHINWQDCFKEDNQEIIIEKDGIKKIADAIIWYNNIKTKRVVFEFQKSPISDEEIIIRENHYGAMIWIFDMFDRVKIPLSVSSCKRPVFLDYGGYLVLLDTDIKFNKEDIEKCLMIEPDLIIDLITIIKKTKKIDNQISIDINILKIDNNKQMENIKIISKKILNLEEVKDVSNNLISKLKNLNFSNQYYITERDKLLVLINKHIDKNNIFEKILTDNNNQIITLHQKQFVNNKKLKDIIELIHNIIPTIKHKKDETFDEFFDKLPNSSEYCSVTDTYKHR